MGIMDRMMDSMTRTGRLVTVAGTVGFINTALNDDELKTELGEVFDGFREKMPEIAEMMRDIMSLMSETGLMDGVIHDGQGDAGNHARHDAGEDASAHSRERKLAPPDV